MKLEIWLVTVFFLQSLHYSMNYRSHALVRGSPKHVTGGIIHTVV